jgi:hypothetical protein
VPARSVSLSCLWLWRGRLSPELPDSADSAIRFKLTPSRDHRPDSRRSWHRFDWALLPSSNSPQKATVLLLSRVRTYYESTPILTGELPRPRTRAATGTDITFRPTYNRPIKPAAVCSARFVLHLLRSTFPRPRPFLEHPKPPLHNHRSSIFQTYSAAIPIYHRQPFAFCRRAASACTVSALQTL